MQSFDFASYFRMRHILNTPQGGIQISHLCFEEESLSGTVINAVHENGDVRGCDEIGVHFVWGELTNGRGPRSLSMDVPQQLQCYFSVDLRERSADSCHLTVDTKLLTPLNRIALFIARSPK